MFTFIVGFVYMNTIVNHEQTQDHVQPDHVEDVFSELFCILHCSLVVTHPVGTPLSPLCSWPIPDKSE